MTKPSTANLLQHNISFEFNTGVDYSCHIQFGDDQKNLVQFDELKQPGPVCQYIVCQNRLTPANRGKVQCALAAVHYCSTFVVLLTNICDTEI